MSKQQFHFYCVYSLNCIPGSR